MARSLAASLLFVLLVPFICSAGQEGAVKGKVNYQGKPLAGAMVYLYSGYEGGFRGKADYQAGPTGADGIFEVKAGKGKYYLIAKKLVKGTGDNLLPGDYYSYYGGNPVVVGEGETINRGINCGPIMDVGEKTKQGG